MWLVVGLGNPEKKYAKNRHNVGFMVLDAMRASLGLPDYREKWKGLFTRGHGHGHELILLKPMTFMNLSGESVQPASAFLKIEPSHLVVVHDEIDLPFADVRLKVGGGHAGHNGLRSIIASLGSPDFYRVRVGVGRPPPQHAKDVADWVLSDFDAIESAELPGVIDRAQSAVERLVKDGPKAAMNAVNTR